jgi:hypothetical protein
MRLTFYLDVRPGDQFLACTDPPKLRGHGPRCRPSAQAPQKSASWLQGMYHPIRAGSLLAAAAAAACAQVPNVVASISPD